jgi:hypothetical protein
MRRYRVLGFDWDSTPRVFSMVIDPTWDLEIRRLWTENRLKAEEEVAQRFGVNNIARKIDYIDLGPAPFSVASFHSTFLKQIRDSFVAGAYYPALTASCALGERLLNYLVLNLRCDYTSRPEYKLVHGKDSFDDWNRVIEILTSWSILTSEVSEMFSSLAQIRNRSLHFSPSTDTNARSEALAAIHLLSQIIERQFAGGEKPWFIPETAGGFFIRKSWEADPFVKLVYLPRSSLVGPRHHLDHENGLWKVFDETYEEGEISDEEFAALYRAHHLRLANASAKS